MAATGTLNLEQLLDDCGGAGRGAGICINAELVPVGGPGTPVNPSIYTGRTYQRDKRWEDTVADNPTDVIVIDNVPSQANRLEAALDHNARNIGIPELILDLSADEFDHLPPHLPRRISSLRFPHRNADAYLRDSMLDGTPFPKTELGQGIFAATVPEAANLVAWFPQALLYGFWQSHLGKSRSQAKHARAWNSEIIGWHPATGGEQASLIRTQGTKGDPVNLQDTAKVVFNDNDLLAGWEYVEGEKSTKQRGKKTDSLSNIGHGQVPFSGNEQGLAAISFKRITQAATCSFAQLRRVQLGNEYTAEQNTAARSLLIALGLHAHQLAFSRGFSLRSGTDLVPETIRVRFHGSDTPINIDSSDVLLRESVDHARNVGVPLDGWNTDPVILLPSAPLTKAICGSWPNLDDASSGGS